MAPHIFSVSIRSLSPKCSFLLEHKFLSPVWSPERSWLQQDQSPSVVRTGGLQFGWRFVLEIMANRNNGNNGGIHPPPPPPQVHVQQVNAIFQAQEDPALSWLLELPEPRKSVPEAVIWHDIDSFPNAATGVLS